MLCKKPFTQGTMAHGCGQCLPCRINRRRLWTHRIMLEALVHAEASFVTLTYEEKQLPEGSNLQPRDLQLYMKRLRKRLPNEIVRYFGCGEYGERYGRPHYHVALFGVGPALAPIAEASWGHGGVHVGELTFASAEYIAGYTTKKIGRQNAYPGRYPEFARMSLRPGIGALAIGDVAKALETPAAVRSYVQTGDVPSVLKHGARSYPLGPYLRKKLRETLGLEGKVPDEVIYKRAAEVLVMYQNYIIDKGRPLGFLQYVQQRDKQKILNVETRHKIFASKGGNYETS